MKQYKPIVHLYTVTVIYINNRSGTKFKKHYYFHLTIDDAKLWIDQTIELKRKRYKLKELTYEGYDRAVYNSTLQIKWLFKIEQIFDYNIRIV